MGDFAVDTQVEGGAGCYRAELSPDWEIWGPNGGYVAAVALRAAAREARIPRPASLSGHFLSVARFGPVDLEVRVLRAGRRSESLRVTITQEGRPIFEALVRTAAEGPGLEHDGGVAPEVPAPGEIPEPGPASGHAFWGNLERRQVKPPPSDQPRGVCEPHWLSWHRFRPRATFDDPFLDAGRALLLIDTLSWPAAALPHPESSYIAPNLDVTAWFHLASPKSDWLLVEQRCRVARGGLMGAEGRVFDTAGRLLASGGAQLLCVPRPADS